MEEQDDLRLKKRTIDRPDARQYWKPGPDQELIK